MSNVEENAFQIARFLLDNSEDGQVAIKKALKLSGEDFGIALKYLVFNGACSTYGRSQGKESGILRNIAKLQEFVNRVNEDRVPLSFDEERLLKFLFDSPTPASDREQTMSSFGWDEKRYQTAFESLKFKDYIDAQYADNKPFDVWITNNGREIVRNNFRLPFQKVIRIGENNDIAGSKVQIMPLTNRPLRVFLCHSSNDKPAVRELYQKLCAEVWIQPWLDEEELHPGQTWEIEIEKAVESSDAVLVCLSNNSINKRGYVQKELRFALDIALEMPEETIFIIPLRLEECTPPRSLRDWQYADYFEGKREHAFERLLVSLKRCADSLGLKIEEPAAKQEEKPIEEKKSVIEVSKSILLEQPTSEWITANKFNLSNGMEFMRVPSGKFLMGSSSNGNSDEKPQHTLDIPYDYWIARFPTTNEQYSFYAKTRETNHPVNGWEKKRKHPIVFISWEDTMGYCQWLNKLLKDELPSGLVLRLPTEAEWEKAARGTDGRLYPWGNTFDNRNCHSNANVRSDPAPIGLCSPQGDSPYGCADMAGNVWEWTHSLGKEYPYKADDGREDEKASGHRVLRGGSLIRNERFARCANRLYTIVEDLDYFGFRVAASQKIPS